MPNYPSRSSAQAQRLSLELEGLELPLPPFARSPVPSACSRWPFAALSSAAPAPRAQLTASGAILFVSGVLLCGVAGSPLSAGLQWSVWLEEGCRQRERKRTPVKGNAKLSG